MGVQTANFLNYLAHTKEASKMKVRQNGVRKSMTESELRAAAIQAGHETEAKKTETDPIGAKAEHPKEHRVSFGASKWAG